MKSFEKVLQIFFSDPDAGILNRELHCISNTPEPDCNFAFEGELEGIGEKIKDDFLPHLAVDIDVVTNIFAIYRKPESCLLHSGAEDAGDFGGQKGKIYPLINCLNAIRFDSREVEERVDQLKEPQSVASRDNQLVVTLGREQVIE